MECPICLGPLNRCPEGIEDNVRRRLTKIRTATCCCTPCGHIFHKACLLTWLDQSNRPPCPVCNVKLSKMKLYPAYLNVDKDKECIGVKKTVDPTSNVVAGTSSWLGSGSRSAVSSTATTTVTMPSAASATYPKPGRHPGPSNSQAIAGTSASAKLSSIAPGLGGGGGVATMTIGAYALTTFGPLPVVAATAIGAPPGATVPRAHPQPLGNLGIGNSSAFVAFPQSSLTMPMSLAMSSTSATAAGRRGVAATATWTRGTEGGNMQQANVPAPMQAQQHQIPRRVAGTVPNGSNFAGTQQQEPNMWPWNFTGDQVYNGNPTEVGGPAHHRIAIGEVGGHSRYSPYRQPPPAHATSSSSLPRRITNIFDTAAYFPNVSVNNGNNIAINNAAPAGNGGGRGSGDGAPRPSMYVQQQNNPNVQEYLIQTER